MHAARDPDMAADDDDEGPLGARAFRRTQGVSGYSLFQPTRAV